MTWGIKQNPSQLGRNIRHMRLFRGLTQRELASRADVIKATITNVETGYTLDVLSGTVSRLAKVLGVSTSALVEDDLSRVYTEGSQILRKRRAGRVCTPRSARMA